MLTPADLGRMSVRVGWTTEELLVMVRVVKDEGDIPDADRPLIGSALKKLWVKTGDPDIGEAWIASMPDKPEPPNESIDVPLPGAAVVWKHGPERL